MKLDSKFFDRLRVKPDAARLMRDACPTCEWQGCAEPGLYPAPKGRGQEREYHRYCLEHVRQYNKSYNYFAGMGDDDIIAYQRSAATGHRPTWSMGVRQAEGRSTERQGWEEAFVDPFGIFGGATRRTESQPERRPLKNLERRSFAALNLEGSETGSEIKARYKELVKRLHPDANGGDRSSEDRLRQIIQAYHYLRSAGFC
jgi:DnaJ-like protein